MSDDILYHKKGGNADLSSL